MRHRPYTERFGAPISTPRESRSAADYACSIERAAPVTRHLARRMSYVCAAIAVGMAFALLLHGGAK